MATQRNIRVTGIRRPFEVGRFVLAVMAHAEALAEADAGAENAAAKRDEPTMLKPVDQPQIDEADGTISEREATSSQSEVDGKEAA